MRKHPIRKFFALLVIYSVIIVGIFVLQFKTESIISKNIGNLHISLAQTESENNITLLRNQFKVSYKGINFLNSESNPVYGISSNGERQILELSDYSQNDLSANFSFKDGTNLIFTLTNLNSDGELSISAFPSANFTEISLPYTISSSYNIQDSSNEHAILSSKSNFYTLIAHNLNNGRISLTKFENIAKFQNYDPTKRFSYEATLNLANSEEEDFTVFAKQLTSQLVSQVQSLLSSTQSDSLSEAEIVAYVAEMTLEGKYNEALDSVPESFRRGNKRTYLSTPYFNNLANMNRSLVMQTGRYESMVESAISSKSLDIFIADGISDYILREKKTSKIQQILELPENLLQSEEGFLPNLNQAVGILNVWANLYKKDESLAQKLENVIQPCLNLLAESFTLENSKISILSENQQENENVSLVQKVLIGNSLVKSGKILNRNELCTTGFLLINNSLKERALELNELAELYTILSPENKFYPHTEILGYYGEKCVWAWTCASSITYEISPDSIVSINIDFPLNYTHHIIFNGIPTFHSQIEIQRQMFRTDPRFETYNSSGYVYQADSQTLLIKSRHKSQIELIRLFCDPTNNFYDINGTLIRTHARSE